MFRFLFFVLALLISTTGCINKDYTAHVVTSSVQIEVSSVAEDVVITSFDVKPKDDLISPVAPGGKPLVIQDGVVEVTTEDLNIWYHAKSFQRIGGLMAGDIISVTLHNRAGEEVGQGLVKVTTIAYRNR